MQIIDEYNGHNIKELATKYGYTEKWVRKILKDNIDNKKLIYCIEVLCIMNRIERLDQISKEMDKIMEIKSEIIKHQRTLELKCD